MLMVQKFHSIHEIDPEFVASLETLLQEEIVSFDTLIQRQDAAPLTDTFTYFLFFGPTQNAPIGFAQLCLRSIPQYLVPWQKKMKFWNKDFEHWKEVIWRIGDGSSGICLFDAKFARSGKEKVQEIIHEYENRPDIMAQSVFILKGLQDFNFSITHQHEMSREFFVLDPLIKSSKNYQLYLENLKPDLQKHIKNIWKNLHQQKVVVLGDYQSIKEAPFDLPMDKTQIEIWKKWGAQVLTFEKDNKPLGCLLVLKGKNGNIFFEPFPFEPEGESIVSDELYTQYALLKFFEMPEAKKCHMMKFGVKLVFEDKSDLQFFQEQGFQSKTINHRFYSRLEGLNHPL